MRRKKQKLNKTALWLAVLITFMGEVFMYTWCRVQCVRVGYEISMASEQQQHLLTRQKNLKIELARLKSPERIAKIAKEKLGLMMPEPGRTTIIQ